MDHEFKEYQLINHHDFYDVPLSGLVKIKDKIYWYLVTGLPKFYNVFELSEEEAEYEMYWYKLFTEMVGGHTAYVNNKRTHVQFENKNPERVREFYTKHKEEYKNDDKKYRQRPRSGWIFIP